MDYCIVTYPDEDHISGLVEIIKSGYKIKNIIMPNIVTEDKAYTELEQLAKQADIKVICFSKGDTLKEGELKLTCLHPYKEYVPASINYYSTVVSLKVGELDMLLIGDVKSKGEDEILDNINEDYDILNVRIMARNFHHQKSFLTKSMRNM